MASLGICQQQKCCEWKISNATIYNKVVNIPHPHTLTYYQYHCTATPCPKFNIYYHIRSIINSYFARFEAPWVIIMKSTVFWDVTLSSPLEVQEHFRGTHSLELQCKRISHARNQREARSKQIFSLVSYLPTPPLVYYASFSQFSLGIKNWSWRPLLVHSSCSYWFDQGSSTSLYPYYYFPHSQSLLCLLLACMAYSSILNMDELCSSKTSVNFYQTTCYTIADDSTLHSDCYENLTSQYRLLNIRV
jgi:hypothetical protein